MSTIRFAEEFLKERPGERFTRLQIAAELAKRHPDWFRKKTANSKTGIDPLRRLASEIGGNANIERYAKKGIYTTDEKPSRYYYPGTEGGGLPQQPTPAASGTSAATRRKTKSSSQTLSAESLENELYEPLCEHLSKKYEMEAMRISESKTPTRRGTRGRKLWAYPDIVAFRQITEDFDQQLIEIMNKTGGAQIEFWSIEVKREIDLNNFRDAYFQAVSNSTWANVGFLAARFKKMTNQDYNRLYKEAMKLANLHGIGLIELIFNGEKIESEMIVGAQQSDQPDWTTLNELVKENKDFAEFSTRALNSLNRRWR